MSDRRALRSCVGAAIAAGAAWLVAGCARDASKTTPEAAGSGASGSARPDVVLVTIDTLRADAVRFAGNTEVETPVLDRLAAAGRVYLETRAHNVVTLPSHANLLTGLYPFQHGIRDNSGFKLDPAIPSLATLLRASGYATGAFVGAFPLDRRYGLANGFERYDDRYPLGSEGSSFVIAERRGDEVVAAALDWWRSSNARPRFLWVHLYDPHAGYTPPEPFKSRYRARPYLGEVAATDSFLAPLLSPHLDGLERPALVVVTADHGEALGEHGELTHGLFAYEATLRVPLVLWGVGVTSGRDTRAARHVDVAPTVLSVVGVASPRRLPGRSLLDLPAAVDSYFESFSTALNRGWAPLRGLVRASRKFVDLPLPELYALDSDPKEAENLVEREQAAAAELRAALPAESAWPPVRAQPVAEEVARLQSLGYAVGTATPRSSYGPADDPKRLLAIDRKLHEVVDLFSRGQLEAAVTTARALVAAHPGNAEGYSHLGLALRELERHEEAIRVLRRGLERASVRDAIAQQLGMALAEVGKTKEAIVVLTPLAGADDPELLRVLASVHSDEGEQARALTLLARAEKLAPDDPRIFEAIAVAHLRAERPAEARAYLERALARNDRSASGWNTLAVALVRLEGPRAAIPAWQKAIELDPKLWDAQYNLGLVAANVGERDLARRVLESYVAHAPAATHKDEIDKARALLARLGR